ncbi:TonB-dependent receptor [Lentimicrobium sp. L6]|uniref:TonB-dependent receptor n=1 Tax=Lentimicrobium sp. L6 TaxID=2735916 RepID=UPI0015554035|nr:TonB-dependent receptor [Lentimicrobium sp. L6]NPD85099.1 TonB-dependent receptor [Lentimicrobium sp. L6]
MRKFYSFKNLSIKWFLLLCFTVYLTSFSISALAQNDKDTDNQTLNDLFRFIENKGTYKIFYQNDQVDLNKDISVNKEESDISTLLSQGLKGTGLSFEILDNHIVIMPKVEDVQKTKKTIIKGLITDDLGETLIGVSVVLKGTFQGAVSDIDGRYELEVPSLDDTLVFTYIGFEKQIVGIAGHTEINVILEMAVFTLDEAVAIGYGIKKQTDIIGAVSVVKSKEISNLPVADVGQALQGKATGVSVTQNSGAPGAGTSIRIRGTGTFNDNSPLYIIDGIPTTDGNAVIPSEIESISILKDAAAASIYGSRASGGVVLITTKKGKEGGMRINFDSYTGIQTATNLTEMCDKDQYIELYNEAANNDGRAIISSEMADTMSNVNYWDEIFRPAVITSTSLSVSGGNEKMNYIVSGNYFHQDGIIINSGYDKYSFRTSMNSNLSDKVQIGTNINLSSAITDKVGSSGDGYGGNGGSVVRYAFFRAPLYSIYDDNGEYVDYYPEAAQFMGDGYNPVGFANKYDWRLKEHRLLGNIFLNWKINDHFTFRTDFGLDYLSLGDKRFNENWGYDGRINNPNTLVQQSLITSEQTWKNTLTYDKVFNEKHNLNILVGMEAIKNTSVGQQGSAQNFPDQIPSLRYLSNGTTNQRVDGWQESWALLSFFGRISYDYEKKYYAEIVVREDGSSRFGSNYPWSFFPAAAIGWRVDKESFLKDVDMLSYLKLRMSAGVLGNQKIGNYSYASIISSGSYYPFGTTAMSGYYLSQHGNENIRWESQTQVDIGLDLGLFGNKLFVVFDYFDKISDDVLINAPLPPSSGEASPPVVNAAKIKNNGIELELSYKDQLGKVKYDLAFVFSHVNNEVLELYDGNPIPAGRIDNGVFATLTEEGHPVGSFYLYEMEGIFQDETDIFTHAYQGSDIKPGDVKYKDISGPTGSPDGIIDSYDRAHVGSPIPDYTLGFNMGLNYKKWDFTLFVEGVFGNEVYWQAAHDIEGFYRAFNVTTRVYDDRWTGSGTSDTQPRVSWQGAANNKKPSTRFLFDASYVRIKNVNLGYTISDIGKNKTIIKSLRIYLSVQNLFTFTKYPGLDPEMQTSDNAVGEGDLAKGIDWGTYPMARVYTLGFNMSF